MIAVAVLAASLSGQQPENPGPFKAAWQTIALTNPYPGSSRIQCLVVYPGQEAKEKAPMDLLGAPYPVVVFGHGFLSDGQAQLELGRHLASWGFLFVAHDTLPLGPQTEQVKDLSALTRVIRDEHRRQGSFFFNTVDVKQVAVAGHSMGGGSTAGVLASTADVQAGLLLAPWVGITPNASDWMKQARAPYQILVGLGDSVAPAGSNASLFYQKGATVNRYRGLTILWKGCDHFSVRHTPSNATPDQIEAFRLCRRQMTSFLLARLQDRHEYLDVLVSDATHAEPKFDQVNYEVRDPDLYLTGAVRVGGRLAYHVMGKARTQMVAYFSPLPFSATIPGLGVLGLHPSFLNLLGSGPIGDRQVAHHTFPVPPVPALAGLRLYVQAAAPDAGNFYRLTPTRTFRIETGP